jgi:hypothetical protein
LDSKLYSSSEIGIPLPSGLNVERRPHKRLALRILTSARARESLRMLAAFDPDRNVRIAARWLLRRGDGLVRWPLLPYRSKQTLKPRRRRASSAQLSLVRDAADQERSPPLRRSERAFERALAMLRELE